MPDKEAPIGVLWVNEGKDGTKYMRGSIEIGGERHQIIIFRNRWKKEGEKSPDFRIFAAKEQAKKDEEELF